MTTIGLLVTILFISYGAYRKNAINAQSASVVQAYIDALNAYRNEYNTYPALPEGFACLGEGNDLLSDGSKTCVIKEDIPTVVRESATYNNAIKPYFKGGGLPKVSNWVVTESATKKYSGGWVSSDTPSFGWTLDGVRHPWFIVYYQEGTTSRCPLGPIVTLQSTGAVGLNLITGVPPQGYTTALGMKGTVCIIALKAIAKAP